MVCLLRFWNPEAVVLTPMKVSWKASYAAKKGLEELQWYVMNTPAIWIRGRCYMTMTILRCVSTTFESICEFIARSLEFPSCQTVSPVSDLCLAAWLVQSSLFREEMQYIVTRFEADLQLLHRYSLYSDIWCLERLQEMKGVLYHLS